MVNGAVVRGMQIFAEVQNSVAARLIYGGDFDEFVVFGVNGMRGVGWQSLLNTKSDLVWLIVSFLDVDITMGNELILEIETMQSKKLSTKKYAPQVTTRKLEIVLGGKKFVVVSSNKFFHEFGRTVR